MSDPADGAATQAARLLLAAWPHAAPRLACLPPPLVPQDWAQVGAIHARLMAQLGPLGGHKVGAQGADAPITLAPLPAARLMANGAVLAGWHQRAVEAEIAVRFAHPLPRRARPYSDAEILAAIGTAHPVIEVLSSRFEDPDALDPLSRAADLMMHGALIVGASVPLPELARERVRVTIDGAAASEGHHHPAGDMLRLLRHVADHAGVGAGHIVTTGSWNPKTIAPAQCEVAAVFALSGTVACRFRAAQ